MEPKNTSDNLLKIQRNSYRDQVMAVRKLHRPEKGDIVCRHCRELYPCTTIKCMEES